MVTRDSFWTCVLIRVWVFLAWLSTMLMTGSTSVEFAYAMVCALSFGPRGFTMQDLTLYLLVAFDVLIFSTSILDASSLRGSWALFVVMFIIWIMLSPYLFYGHDSPEQELECMVIVAPLIRLVSLVVLSIAALLVDPTPVATSCALACVAHDIILCHNHHAVNATTGLKTTLYVSWFAVYGGIAGLAFALDFHARLVCSCIMWCGLLTDVVAFCFVKH